MKNHKTFYFGYPTGDHFQTILEKVLTSSSANAIHIRSGCPKGDYGQTVEIEEGALFTVDSIPKILDDIEEKWKTTFNGYVISNVRITKDGIHIRYHQWKTTTEMIIGD